MFKKAAQIAVTFSLLVLAYMGYTRGFAIVSAQLLASRGGDEEVPFTVVEAKSLKIANDLATEQYGAESWQASKDRRMTYYDSRQGAYIYALNYKFLDDRKRIKVWPFAMISVSKDGKSRKSATSQEAIIDMSQPFGDLKPRSEPSKVVHARMTGDVRIVDDKGTRDPGDDLHVDMDFVEYDEKTLQIMSESDIDLRDRDLKITGIGLTIQLRRKSDLAPNGGGGFEAETLLLRKDPVVDIENVTSTGVLPGASKPDPKNKTRLVATCAGGLLITLPQPRAVVRVGPPDPFREPDPTFARFERNVKVVRGTANPDQLNCDTLDLTLRPDRKVVLAEVEVDPTKPEAPAGGGPLTELKIRKAVAKGHAVWLQSESQGMVAKCLELTYEKNLGEGIPDKTYLNGGLSGKLWVEKIDRIATGPKAGTIAAVREVRAMDTTILDYGPGGKSEVIARGPGQMDERPARNASVERRVWWEDDMVMLTWRDKLPPAPPTNLAPATIPGPGTLWRRITLTGPSKLVDYKGGHTLDAQERIVALFESKPKPAPATGDGEARIERLDAFKDVHLTTNGKVLTGRDEFYAKFVHPELPAAVAIQPVAPAAGAGPAPAIAPIVVASAGPESAPLPEAKPEAPPAKVEPAVDGRANVIFATILQGLAGGKSEVQDAKLRGSVLVHQDPAAGEVRGKDLTGEALDINGQGAGLMNFVVFAEDPQAFEPKTRLAGNDPKDAGKIKLATAKGRSTGGNRLARVDFNGLMIEAPRIGLDQKANYVWGQGAGHIYQMAERGLLDDKGLASSRPPGAAKGPGTKQQMLITWNGEMKGYGYSQDFEGRPVAKFEFRGESQDVRTPNGSRDFRRGVQAKMEDSAIFCDTMDVYMDKTIAFDKVNTPKPAGSVGAAKSKEPDPEIALLDCRGEDHVTDGIKDYAGVDISSRKMYPATGLLKEKQRIQHVHVVYDKRTGKFEAPGAGRVLLYQGATAKPQVKKEPTNLVTTSAVRQVSQVSPTDGTPTLKLTQIDFTEGMRGNFGVAKDQSETETRWSEFVGNVQAVNAVVEGPNSSIDLDRPPADYMSITSDVLRVRSIPPPASVKGPASQTLFGDGNAVVRTASRLIQGDRVTFDSAKDLAYIYGDDGKEIVMSEQKAIGQPPNVVRGKSGMFNNKTRQFSLDNPQAFQMFDLKTALRPKAFDPDLGGSPKPMPIIKLPRQPLKRDGRQSTERNGFTGH